MELLAMARVASAAFIALECTDPRALAEFYAAVTGLQIVTADSHWVTLGTSDAEPHRGLLLAFQRAPGHLPPTWPDPTSSMQMHLDLRTADLEAAETEVLRLGATKLYDQPGNRFRVYADPAGHPFCLFQE
jgi:hypothetical protein